jgi:hypothetical protein
MSISAQRNDIRRHEFGQNAIASEQSGESFRATDTQAITTMERHQDAPEQRKEAFAQ